MIVGTGVKMNTVHLDQATLITHRLHVVVDALLQDMIVPATDTFTATQNELNRRVSQLEGLGPLVGNLCVVLLGHLSDLPCSPHLVADGPVLHIVGLLVAILAAEVGVVCVFTRVTVLDPCQCCHKSQLQVARSEI